ncbi:MAG: diacylglycerol kinase family protein [Gordonia sp. (in: high G+C Gram-positive bacteria)]|uniref:bifunctional phosphatase PAP2/diacylglycerol kinase family protein n=1 Tax=Gordonia sp. (in: high G+C Gram-positive bacteria) TaxID=84139 RepID=UPI003BB4D46A
MALFRSFRAVRHDGLGRPVPTAESSLESLTGGLSDLDLRVFDAVANSPSPMLDRTMKPLSAAADQGKLWFAIAAGLGLTGVSSLERGAVRGVVTLGAASLVANQVGKRLHPRQRPDTEGITVRRLRRQPTSSSFPSGHSASAAAFAIGVGIENRPAGYLLAGLAGMVGLSRVVTGAHYPFDVVAGFALGAGIAVAGAQIVRPVDDHAITVAAPHRVPATPRPDGEGLVILVNPRSGDGTGERVQAEIEQSLPAAEIVDLSDVDDLVTTARDAARRAEVLGVAGGDGTVSTVAAAALEADIPLAVFPGGTFNHFAKDIGSQRVARTVEAIRAGLVTRVDVLWLNDAQVILNTSSIGAYPEFVVARDRYNHSVSKPIAAIRAARHVLRHSQPVTVQVNDEEIETLFFFVGNGMYGTAGFFPGRRTRLDDGLIDVRYLVTGQRFETLRLTASLLSGRIKNSRLFIDAQIPEFSLTAAEPIRVAHDGEAGEEQTAAHYRVDYRTLKVYGTSVVTGRS